MAKNLITAAKALQDVEIFIKGIKYTNCEIGHPRMQ